MIEQERLGLMNQFVGWLWKGSSMTFGMDEKKKGQSKMLAGILPARGFAEVHAICQIVGQEYF